MRVGSILLLSLSWVALGGCNGGTSAEHGSSAELRPGRAPPPAPAPVTESEVEVETGDADAPPEPVVDPDPVMAERKQALANVGRSAFDALKAGDFEALLALTPMVDPYLAEHCAKLPLSPRKELEARFSHCHGTIDWDAVTEAQAFAGKPTGAEALGCEANIEDYGRLQLFLHMSDASIWKVEFYGAVGEGGNAIGLNGEVKCSPTDEAPALH